jgi:hypothetical protein
LNNIFKKKLNKMEQNLPMSNVTSPQQTYSMYNTSPTIYQDFYAHQYQSMLPQNGYFNFYNPYYTGQYSQYAVNPSQVNYYKPIASPDSSTEKVYENLLTPNSSYSASQNSPTADSQQLTPTLPSASKAFFPTPSSENEYERESCDKKADFAAQQKSPVAYPKEDDEEKKNESAKAQAKRRTRTQFTKAQVIGEIWSLLKKENFNLTFFIVLVGSFGKCV